ncbi:MAG TPA: hypothetical protein VJ965_04265, partial [Anaerolineales bacterium]|nr:hypothetical protein [Anaerolineales bacterium]
FLLLALTAALVLVFKDFLMAYVFSPVAALGWAVWRMIGSLHQNVLWITLLLAGLILTIWLIPPKKDRPPSSAYQYNYKPPNRYENWRKQFAEAVRGKNEQDYLRKNLETLAANFDQNRTPLPDAAEQYLSGQDQKRWSFSTLVPGWLRKLTGGDFDQDSSSINALLSWMETELEIQNDDNPNP